MQLKCWSIEVMCQNISKELVYSVPEALISTQNKTLVRLCTNIYGKSAIKDISVITPKQNGNVNIVFQPDV